MKGVHTNNPSIPTIDNTVLSDIIIYFCNMKPYSNANSIGPDDCKASAHGSQRLQSLLDVEFVESKARIVSAIISESSCSVTDLAHQSILHQAYIYSIPYIISSIILYLYTVCS